MVIFIKKDELANLLLQSIMLKINKNYYYINCSVLQGFLPPRNVVSEHT